MNFVKIAYQNSCETIAKAQTNPIEYKLNSALKLFVRNIKEIYKACRAFESQYNALPNDDDEPNNTRVCIPNPFNYFDIDYDFLETWFGNEHGWLSKGLKSAVYEYEYPKIYEIVADKRAVDFMVNAGYNPIGLITYINKAFPQKRFDRFSSTNLTSKRLAIIYEYIYTKYPYYLTNNKYLETDSYQNFLLNSTNNRKLLEEKIKNNLKGDLDYE